MSRISSVLTSCRPGVRVTAGQPYHQVGGLPQQPHRRPGEPGQQVQRPGGQQRPTFGALHREPLGRQLTDDQGHERQHHRHQHDRGRFGGTAEEPQRLDQRLRQ
jgi:hypothetical protein